MKPEQVFKIVNIVVLPPWFLMMVLPKNPITAQIINSNVFPIGLGVLYIIYIVQSFGKAKGNFMSLNGLSKLYTNKEALLAGWVHYLVGQPSIYVNVRAIRLIDIFGTEIFYLVVFQNISDKLKVL